MKTRNLIKRLYAAILAGDLAREQKIWFKILKKSLKHKSTQAVR